jgi:hypothetical protein
MEQHLHLKNVNDGNIVDATEYRSLIGSLHYLVNTRPDIAHAVGIVSRYMELELNFSGAYSYNGFSWQLQLFLA